MIAHVATKGIELAASMLEGDWDKSAEAFKRIPIIGEGATAGFHLGTAMSNTVGPAVYAALKAIPNLFEGKLEMTRFFGSEAKNDIAADIAAKREADDKREADNTEFRRESINPPPPGHSPLPAPVGPARGPTQNQISYQSISDRLPV